MNKDESPSGSSFILHPSEEGLVRRHLDALEGEFDLLVVGGGITGAGTALDAVTRGLRVALVDRGDFASGTSSISSKLVHGGLRYLEQGALGLVYEALRERRRLLGNASHLVRPLRFVLPFYHEARVRPWKWRAGLLLYDLLAGRHNLTRSRSRTTAEILAGCPQLFDYLLQGGAEFSDAQMDDARLCLAVVRTAMAFGAAAVNHAELIAFEQQAGRVIGGRILDRLGGKERVVHARCVVNATGPWVDHVRRLAGEDVHASIAPTKGVHVIAPNHGLKSAFLLLHPADGRVFFVIPWMGKTLLGTTDTDYPDSPDALVVTDADTAYLLDGFNHHFRPGLERGDLLGHFVGVRPLARAKPGEPSTRSREFHVARGTSGLITVSGGKFTTYRHMAEVIVDRVLRRLGRWRPCRTRDLLLDGAPEGEWPDFAPREARRLREGGVAEGTAWHLVNRYGTRAQEVAAVLAREPDLALPIVPGEPDVRGELVYQRECEMACAPADHLLRRTRLGLFRPGLLEESDLLGKRGVFGRMKDEG